MWIWVGRAEEVQDRFFCPPLLTQAIIYKTHFLPRKPQTESGPKACRDYRDLAIPPSPHHIVVAGELIEHMNQTPPSHLTMLHQTFAFEQADSRTAKLLGEFREAMLSCHND